ncbi:DNA-binding protein, partial [Klebsiella pneumoniae subsp. ozaenae]
MSSVQLYYSAPELALMKLSGFPQTSQAINAKAKKEGYVSRSKAVGKGVEYALESLPSNVRKQILKKHYADLLHQTPSQSVEVGEVKAKIGIKPRGELEVMRKCPALLERKTNALTTGQKDIADARMVLVVEVMRLMDGGMPRKGAVELVAKESQASSLPPALQKAADKAN